MPNAKLLQQASIQIKQHEENSAQRPTEKNAAAQRLIKAMQQPPYATPEDVESLIKIIKESRKSTTDSSNGYRAK